MQALRAPLPEGWQEATTEEGSMYYFNVEQNVSTWEHPLDDHFRQLYQQEKAKAQASRQNAAAEDLQAEQPMRQLSVATTNTEASAPSQRTDRTVPASVAAASNQQGRRSLFGGDDWFADIVAEMSDGGGDDSALPLMDASDEAAAASDVSAPAVSARSSTLSNVAVANAAAARSSERSAAASANAAAAAAAQRSSARDAAASVTALSESAAAAQRSSERAGDGMVAEEEEEEEVEEVATAYVPSALQGRRGRRHSQSGSSASSTPAVSPAAGPALPLCVTARVAACAHRLTFALRRSRRSSGGSQAEVAGAEEGGARGRVAQRGGVMGVQSVTNTQSVPQARVQEVRDARARAGSSRRQALTSACAPGSWRRSCRRRRPRRGARAKSVPR